MRLAFVDLETTGGSPVEDRITEVGIIEVDLDERGAGVHPVREWSALVNPDAPIPPFIETLTGITNAMVAEAPRFEELADDILARLDGRLFIAHNARFDHGFLKNAFRRMDRPFRPPVLCTVRLSRKLYPGYARHNLDTLIERHRLIVEMRHRAIGDARLLWQLWQKLHDALPAEQISKAIDQLTARPSLPRHLDPDVLDTLPKSAGVYLFHGGTDAATGEDRQQARCVDDAVANEARQRVEQISGSPLAGRIEPAGGRPLAERIEQAGGSPLSGHTEQAGGSPLPGRIEQAGGGRLAGRIEQVGGGRLSGRTEPVCGDASAPIVGHVVADESTRIVAQIVAQIVADVADIADDAARRVGQIVADEHRGPVEQLLVDERPQTVERPVAQPVERLVERPIGQPIGQPFEQAIPDEPIRLVESAVDDEPSRHERTIAEEPTRAVDDRRREATDFAPATNVNGPPPRVEEPRPLYIGKAKNLRQRVMAHFTGDHLSAREMEISQQMTRIEWIETGGGTQHDLGALLTEATLVKQRMPAYNRQLRKNEDVCAWRLVIDRDAHGSSFCHAGEARGPASHGPPSSASRRSRPGWKLALARPDDLFFAVDPDLYGPFATPRQAGVALRAIADAHGLCPAVLKLEKAQPGKPCFSHQVKRCHGACVGLETALEHAERLKQALASTALRPWPFAGAVAFQEGHTYHVVDGWAYLGMARDLDEARRLAAVTRLFDHDVYRLLVGRIDQLALVGLDR